MSIRHKLLESKAEKVRYCFTGHAQQTHLEGPVGESKEVEDKGVHISCENSLQKVNVFLPAEDALKLFIGLRDSLRATLAEMTDEDKLILRVLAERDAWGLERFTERKSHVAEDLGL
jgi:hypothetical protein